METGLVKQAKAQEKTRGRPGGPGFAEYLLIVYPHGDIEDRLLEEQQQFSTDYGLERASNGGGSWAGSGVPVFRNRPHITLAAFQAGEEAEDTLIRWIQRICQGRRSFDITLNNYSGIPPHTTEPPEADRPQGQTLAMCREDAKFYRQRIPGTIFLRVQDPEPLRELIRQLGSVDEFIRSSGWPPANLTERPYLSIAGGLTEQVYNKAMPDYSRRTFHGAFRADELLLLKRRHSFDPCRTVNVFRLLPE